MSSQPEDGKVANRTDSAESTANRMYIVQVSAKSAHSRLEQAERVAQEVAYTLRGKHFGPYVILPDYDHYALDLAIALAGGQMKRSYPQLLSTAVIIGLLACQGLVGAWFWSTTIQPMPHYSLEKVFSK